MPPTHSIWKLAGNHCLDPVTLHEQCQNKDPLIPVPFWGRANSFVLSAGLNPCHGWVLLMGRHLPGYGTTQGPTIAHPAHTLEVEDGSHTFTFKNLAVVNYQAILPSTRDVRRGAPPFTGPARFNVGPLGRETPYLVELADARYFASDTTCLIKHWNYHNLNSQPASGPTGWWSQFLHHIWDNSFQTLLGPLSINSDVNFPPTSPEHVIFAGENLWYKFNSIIEELSLRLIPYGGTSYEIVPRDYEMPYNSNKTFYENLKPRIIHTEGASASTLLPEKVTVYFRSRNWQWQHSLEDPSPPDLWKHQPYQFAQYATTDLIGAQWTRFTLPGSEKKMFSATVPWSMELLDEADNGLHMATAKTLALNYLKSLTSNNAGSSYTLSSYMPADSRYWDGIAYYDTGEGPLTTLMRSGHDIHPYSITTFRPGQFFSSNTPPNELQAPADAQREHHPHYRYAVASLPTYTVDNQTVKELAPHKATTATLLYGSITGTTLIWNESGQTISVWNPFSKPLPLGRAYRIEYNYQPGGDGIWQVSTAITETGGSPGTDVTGTCRYPTPKLLSYDEVGNPAKEYQTSLASWSYAVYNPLEEGEETTDQNSVIEPDRIIANRNSSLRVSPHDYAGEKQAILDIAAGPRNTIFWSPSKIPARVPTHKLPGEEEGTRRWDRGGIPKWIWEPKIWGSIKIGGWYRFGEVDVTGTQGGVGREISEENERSSGIGPPSTGSCQIRLPDSTVYSPPDTIVGAPAGPFYRSPATGKFLQVASTDGESGVKTRWSDQGLNVKIAARVLSGWNQDTQEEEYSVATLTFVNGMLLDFALDNPLWSSVGDPWGANPNPNPDTGALAEFHVPDVTSAVEEEVDNDIIWRDPHEWCWENDPDQTAPGADWDFKSSYYPGQNPEDQQEEIPGVPETYM